MAVFKGANGKVLLFAGRKALLASPTADGGTTTPPAPTYATTFTVSAPASMVVGTAYPVTITPNGTWPLNEVVALGLSGLAGTFTNGIGNGTAAVVIQFTPTAAGNGFINASAQGMTSAGNISVSVASAQTTTPPVSTGPMSQTFAVSNWGSVSSLGVIKRGVWFKKGDVPAGSIPALSSGAVQFYGLSRWKDGSLKTARLLLRDAGLTAGSNRSYTMTTVTGGMTAAASGNAGLVSAISGHDFKVAFANVKDSTGAVYSGGSLTASLAAHAGVGTRWTVLTTGPVADVWQGWGMAGSDAHLKVNWYVTRWKAADGSTLAWQIGAIVALDWWSVAGATLLTYDATLMDGASTIVSYPNVQHPYHSQWLMAVNDGSLNAGTAPWVGAAQPTLFAPSDKAYLVSTGLIPPLNQTKIPTAEATPTYTPCGNMEHRAFIDGTGAYPGRGVVTEPDAVAFMRGDAQAYARARVNALAGLGVPYHYRSNRQRIRPGEVADTANTIIPLLMAPKAASYSDFTAQGLPMAVDAYNDNRSQTQGMDGYVVPVGGSGVWNASGDSSHAVSYCYFMALISGDEWLVEAQLDLAMNLAHQTIYGYTNYAQAFARNFNPATPADYWTGLLGQNIGDNPRALGWTNLIMGTGFMLPVDHVAHDYAAASLAHNCDYISVNLQYLPASFSAAGYYQGDSALGLNSLMSPWMGAIITTGTYMSYMVSEEPRLRALGDWMAAWGIRNVVAGRFYALDQYRTACRPARAAWNASTNDAIPSDQQPFLNFGAALKGSTGMFTLSSALYWNASNSAPPPMVNGDVLYVTTEVQDNSNGSLGPFTEGQKVYMVNVTNGTLNSGAYPPSSPITFQVSATLGGTPMTFGTDAGSVNFAWVTTSVANYSVAQAESDYLKFPYIPSWGNYVPIHGAAIAMARQTGNAAATDAVVAGLKQFMAPMNQGSDYYAPYDMVAA